MKLLFPVQAPTRVMRRGSKIGGYSQSSQFKEQLSLLMQTLNESVPRYVRCIKPNSLASSDPSNLNEDMVKEQLRAGSILEAIRIRKIGYGFRISYEEFGDQFWPILGARVFEVDNTTVEMIFQKAGEICTDAEESKLLSQGEGWRCGVTKLFMKDETRYILEATLNRLR